MPISELRLTKAQETQKFDHLHIGSTRKSVTGYINVLKFIDNDTKQLVLYVPSLEISSYGENEAKASDMLLAEIHTFLDQLLSESPSQLAKTLQALGFKQEKLRHKDFSKTTEGAEENLKDFNIEGKIDRLALVA